MKKVTELVAELAAPAVAEQGCTLWDVEYVREAGQWYLRLYLDKDGKPWFVDEAPENQRVLPATRTANDGKAASTTVAPD